VNNDVKFAAKHKPVNCDFRTAAYKHFPVHGSIVGASGGGESGGTQTD